MGFYIAKRLISSLITIFVVTTITFFLMRIMPGGPFNSDKITPQIRANIEAKYGLDKPILKQYTLYMTNLIKGDFGVSMVRKGRKVEDIIKTHFPSSAKLGIATLLFSVSIGILLGVYSALKYNKLDDKIITIFSTLCNTIPSFVIGAVLIYVFGVKLKWLPPTGFDGVKHYIMPVLALSGSSIAFITRLTRAELVDAKRSDYMRTAKAKGLSNANVIVKHGLRNSLIPVITFLGPLVAALLTGTFVVETMFAIPGLGSEFVNSVTNRDYTTLLGVTAFYCSFVVICNLIVDILYVVIDPRIKLQNTDY
jgi:oligopeptide transport system permease protein